MMLMVTIEQLPLLGKSYLRNVLSKMRNKDEATVRIGLLGDFKTPNYQVKLPNGVYLTYRGANHNRFGKDSFESSHLSVSFTFAQISSAYDKASSV
ncbi:hypothetical protein PBPRA0879 [Photobacterium profundum SS9]|uniref:Uncharacterized protein n=2 Tax=Photobacterium profundum TaxID=74109 RepID=Q6LTT4_PHOPR|nr:hypothetical protein PBPRA0879 [Photobacterium profundum SS9]